MPPDSRWKAHRSRGIQKNDKKGSGASVGASEPLFTIGAVTANSQFSVAALSVKTGQRSVRRRSAVPKLEIIFPLKMPRAQRRRPPQAAEAGRSCWGSGQQDASAAQGTMRMLGAATRKKRRPFKIVPVPKEAVAQMLCSGLFVYGALLWEWRARQQCGAVCGPVKVTVPACRRTY